MSSTASNASTDQILNTIARDHLGIEALDWPSFPDRRRTIVHIWQVKEALEAAFRAGAASVITSE